MRRTLRTIIHLHISSFFSSFHLPELFPIVTDQRSNSLIPPGPINTRGLSIDARRTSRNGTRRNPPCPLRPPSQKSKLRHANRREQACTGNRSRSFSTLAPSFLPQGGKKWRRYKSPTSNRSVMFCTIFFSILYYVCWVGAYMPLFLSIVSVRKGPLVVNHHLGKFPPAMHSAIGARASAPWPPTWRDDFQHRDLHQ